MRVRWTEPASNHWQESFEYIEAESPDAASRLAAKVIGAIQMLAAHPYAGHIGRIAGTREFAVPGSPFVIVYDVNQRGATLDIIEVYDGRRRWPRHFPRE